MIHSKSLILLISLSIGFYFLLIQVLGEQPFNMRVDKTFLDIKFQSLHKSSNPKLIILAGSNGLYSHRCSEFNKVLMMNCTNLSMNVNFSLNYMFNKLKANLQSGDVLFLPLEFQILSGPERYTKEIPYAHVYDKSYLKDVPIKNWNEVFFYFDLEYFFGSFFQWATLRYNRKNLVMKVPELTKNGDKSGHTIAESQKYRSIVNNYNWENPKPKSFKANSPLAKNLSNFLTWAKKKGVIVVGGLPVIFNDSPLSDELIGSIELFYQSHGHKFLVLENKSQYPRNYFFDVPFHLSEEYQILHSEKVAKELKNVLRNHNL